MEETQMFIPNISEEIITVTYCDKCRGRYSYWCGRQNHPEINKVNLPFVIPDLTVTKIGKWVRLYSEKLKKDFSLSSSRFKEVVQGCGILPGGHIPNQWWIISNVGGSITLKWLGSTDGKYVP